MEKIDFNKQQPTKEDNRIEFLCVVKMNVRSFYELAEWSDETDIYPEDKPCFVLKYEGVKKTVTHYYRLENI